ncbi:MULTISPECIES: hypothetical protein [Fusobacterium]|jgi:hypothetical protein|uniref:Lipoprotein n=3 Tax=Fusobacterium TaxID=848 RepID=A0AAD0HSU5_9FUSO|nr:MULTISPECIES: hypothetical protein [Fusobacterium]ATV70104.1 hypothetical protein CTM98_05260 [Fusobacterium pseudoperiodonticum]AVQ24414.1 hypothetical protein C4N17_01085 [Fusobacterium periodonticum]KGE62756.1 hypothetical protein FSAG_001365 [Fusobacterium periodonticum 2_1_31]PIM77276.1 hypothetical protein CTM69_10720 [Fusobacterium pseudoperiodonticum]
MIKNSFKFIILTILVIIANACSSNSNSFWGFKPHFSTGTYIHSYAIIEDGKVNRMGIPKKDIDKMDSIINDKYGIQFIDDNRIYALKGGGENYKIKFYNDFKMTVNGKEYIMPKEKIRYSAYDYDLELPIKITNTNYNEYILDIGEIEIIDTDGKIIRPRTKIPPILFKKTIYRTFVNDITGSDYDVYYRGWAEDYPKDPSTLKKMYNNLEKKFGKLKNIKK